MKYSVDLTRSAEADLIDIVEWIAGNDSSERAGLIHAKLPQHGCVLLAATVFRRYCRDSENR